MKRDVIYFSPIPWAGLYQRPQHSARQLAGTRRVLYVEPRTLHAPEPPADEERLAFLTLPIIPTNARNPLLRRAARAGASLAPFRRLYQSRQSALLAAKVAALGLSDPLLLFGHPVFASLRCLFPTSPLVYDHMDDILRFGTPTAALARDLRALVSEAALVNATSARLAAEVEALGARRVIRIGNGVEWARFAKAGAGMAEPPLLAPLPRPRIIYAGSVAEWFDLDLLFELARRMPGASFPVIGPLRPSLAPRLRRAPANLRFFGARPYAEVPAWLAHSQAALIPFHMTPLTEAVDPVKIYEYLAAGLPVVSTPFSPELRALSSVVRLGRSAGEFADALAALLQQPPDPERQRAAAAERSWDRLLESLAAELDSL